MATALLVYSGISLKMLVDQRLDAALHTMFMVEYEPNANAHPHDHPLEEAYYIMFGEVEAWADDQKYLMKPGDFLWAGVGCTHAFYNRGRRQRPLARDAVAAAAGAQFLPLGARLGIRGRAAKRTRSRPMSSSAASAARPSVVVIGGTGGIGHAIAEFYAKRGSKRRDHGPRRRAHGRQAPRKSATTCAASRSTSPSPSRSRSRLAGIEHVDHLALVAVERDYNSAREYDIARARRIVTMKLIGYTEVAHTLYPRMGAGASAVLFGGLASERPYPGSTSITTVNGAVSSLIRTLAVELAPVRFNAIHPGIISDSPAWRDKLEAIANIEKRTPGGRLATTDDVVHSVDFLFTNRGVNGINLVIDGGWLLT